MTTEQLLFFLLASLSLGVLALVFVTASRLSGSVKLELELGAAALTQALRERDQARALAHELRESLTVTSHVTQPLHPQVPVQEEKETGNGSPAGTFKAGL